MSKKVWHELLAGTSKLSKFGKINVAINFMIGLTGLLTAISGVYFLFDTSNSHSAQALFLFNRTTWDMIHTWAGVLMIIAFILHFAIHWKWVTKVTRRYFSNEKRVVKPIISREQPVFVQTETQQ
jgi:cytochrome b subunit of formate dehydrogenase